MEPTSADDGSSESSYCIQQDILPVRIGDFTHTLLSYRCPRFSQKAKRLLASYDISPAPRIIEVDTRDDGPLLKRLLGRFTAHNTFPNIVLRGNSLGGSDDLQKLHAEGELRKLLEKEGFSFGVGRSG